MANTGVSPKLMLKTAQVASHATEALGKDNAMTWLQKPNAALDGKTPLEILSDGDPTKVQNLDDQLTALEYGMFS